MTDHGFLRHFGHNHDDMAASVFCRSNDGRHSQQFATEFDRRGSLVIGHEAEVPDADESLRQHVNQETSDELVGGNRHHSLLVAASVVPPTEGDVVAVEGDESVVGDGDAMGIASEIANTCSGPPKAGLA